MLGKATMMAPDGTVREYAVYVDNRDLRDDYAAGILFDGEPIIYRNILCAVMGTTPDDGEGFTELIEISGLNGFTFIINQGGPAA